MTTQNTPADHRPTDRPMRGVEFRVPVSLGELLDKIGILEIKRERIIQQAKQSNIQYEWELLTAELNQNLPQMPEEITSLAQQLKIVNQVIWDAEDVVHAKELSELSDAVFLAQARIAFEHNDKRARLKRRINDLVGSAVIEEKSYADFGKTV